MEIYSKSTIFNIGLVGVSTHIILVFFVINFSKLELLDKSPKLNFKFEVLFLTFSNSLLDPPYKSSIAKTSSPELSKDKTVSAAASPDAKANALLPPSKSAMHIS